MEFGQTASAILLISAPGGRQGFPPTARAGKRLSAKLDPPRLPVHRRQLYALHAGSPAKLSGADEGPRRWVVFQNRRPAWPACDDACGRFSWLRLRLRLHPRPRQGWPGVVAAAWAWDWNCLARGRRSCRSAAARHPRDCREPEKSPAHAIHPIRLRCAACRGWPAIPAGDDVGVRFAVHSWRHYHIAGPKRPTVARGKSNMRFAAVGGITLA